MENLNSGHNIESCMSKHSMQNLYEMRANNMLCDGTITLDDDVVLNVHRPILCACSDYFKCVKTINFLAIEISIRDRKSNKL